MHRGTVVISHTAPSCRCKSKQSQGSQKDTSLGFVTEAKRIVQSTTELAASLAALMVRAHTEVSQILTPVLVSVGQASSHVIRRL